MKRSESQKSKNSLYEKRLSEALTESRRDYEEGRFYSSLKELVRAVRVKCTAINAQPKKNKGFPFAETSLCKTVIRFSL